MFPCYYVEKIDEVKKCVWQSFTRKTIQNSFLQKLIRVTACKIVGNAL